MTHASLFSGIGGFDLAAHWAGYQNTFMVEKNPFCQKVLAKNFPDHTIYSDIKDFNDHHAQGYQYAIDIISGGFPCQPFSLAGKRKGTTDERFLWGEMLRAIQLIRPTYVLAENVLGLLSQGGGMVFENICLDLENEGYRLQTFVLPAISQGAPHKRDRVWIVAHSEKFGREKTTPYKTDGNTKEGKEIAHPFALPDSTYLAYPQEQGQQGQKPIRQPNRDAEHFRRDWYEVATGFCGVHDGLPNELDKLTHSDRGKRLAALGNAIVPQVAFPIFQAIQKTHVLYDHHH